MVIIKIIISNISNEIAILSIISFIYLTFIVKSLKIIGFPLRTAHANLLQESHFLYP